MEAFNHYIPSSSQDTLQHKRRYHVFLSFRGPDVRKSLVDHLFQSLSSAGFHVFLDTERLEKGENIGISLEEAIRDSTVHIPIFSSNYASSAWCLHELSLIWTCKSTCPQTKTIPLFYDVEPSMVRYQTGIYGESLEALCAKGRHSTAEMEKWKEVLHNVSLLSGWSLSLTAAGYEGRLVKQVVMDLLQTLKIDWLHVAKHPVGLPDPMEEVTKLLEINSDIRQRTVGIWGMGGMGKTTLSKAVYNNVHHLFQASCFVSDIRATAKESVKGLVNLQRQILSELANVNTKFKSVDHGIMQMKTHLASKKVLVILDDVDHQKQLDALVGDCYGPGSRIIITTRDEKVLQLGKIDKIHPMKGLSQDEGVQLFSWHAFLRSCPENGYEDVALKIVNACQGLPLSLEVLGAHLYGERSMRIWNEALQKIHNEVYQSLKISYDALSHEEQQMFLDIACFFIMSYFSSREGFYSREDYTLNFYLGFWEELGCTTAYTSLKSLEAKSLIRIEEEEDGSYCRFWMHDHLRDLGRGIVKDESPDDPSKRSRLWCEKDILSALQHTEEMPKVRGLMLTGSKLHQMDNLALMHNLKFLFCDGVDPLREITMLPRDLRYLFLSSCGWDTDFSPPGQVQFLCYLRINGTPLANHPSEVGHLHFLKELHITFCPLKELPRLPESLIHIKLERCMELQKISSMSPMIKLETLHVSMCDSLTELPELNWMQSLRELTLCSCNNLKELPPLPESLIHITLIECNALQKVSSMSPMIKLETLHVSSCDSLAQLPELNWMQSLRELTLSFYQNLKELPPLPESLIHIKLEYCSELQKICSMSPMIKLETLHVSSCHSLAQLPPLPKGLLTLTLHDCVNLKEMASLPESLINISTHGCYQLQINASQPSTRDKGKHMISDPNNETDPSGMRYFPKRCRTMEPSLCFSEHDFFMEQGGSSVPPPADPDYEIPNNVDTAYP